MEQLHKKKLARWISRAFKNSTIEKWSSRKRKKSHIILGQFSPSLRSPLKGAPKFTETWMKNDIVELLKLIRGICCKHDQNNDMVYAVMNSLMALFINFQRSNMRNDNYS